MSERIYTYADKAGEFAAVVTPIGFGADGTILTPVSSTAQLPTKEAYLPPATWSDPTTAFDARLYSDVEIQVVTTPTVAYAPQRSLDGTNYVATNAFDKDGNTVTSITAAGIYSLDGGGYLKLPTGSGSTIILRAGA